MSPKMIVETIKRGELLSVIVWNAEGCFCTIAEQGTLFFKENLAVVHNGLVTSLLLAGYKIEDRLFDATDTEERFPERTTLVIP